MCSRTITTFACCQRMQTLIQSPCQDFMTSESCNVPPTQATDPGPCAGCLNLRTNAPRHRLPSGQSRLSHLMGENPVDEQSPRSPFVEIPAQAATTYTQWPRTASAWNSYDRMFSPAEPEVTGITTGPAFDREEARQVRQGSTITDRLYNNSPRRERVRNLSIAIPSRDGPPAYDPRARTEPARDSRIGSAKQVAESGGMIARLASSEEVPSPEQSPLEEAIQYLDAVTRPSYRA
ncbi:hypothetical protein BKA64DRAFT_777045 [Cadophora sp. MPI-SDFR-AT-0126]|nr:hypothetical protein BKA64DRAFT_777045 [Leotiomycetes sp. MPI-SDFR-AT-0126]